MENKKELLEDILSNYAVPDPKIVGKLPKGGMQLDFVGHADITRILIEIDPLWSYEPCGWDNGRPAIHVENGMATMWGYLTIYGKKMLGVGSVRADKQELDKELVGDFLRNAAMRFGISLSLWTKNEWEDLGGHAPAPQKSIPARKPAPKPVANVEVTSTIPVDPEIIGKFIKACADANLDHDKVADHAGVNLSNVTNDDMNKLRAAFKEMSQNK
jgi:hypothetical protein